ncbi:MAG: YlxR family protein [Clostridia bacterium]|nr:YlxR family protein [Clostridia bacterium]MBR2296673.1 YlxR family protein [Clostridia bacterium]
MLMEKKIPQRRCLGCMQSFPKKELIRVVRTPEGEICIDLTGKKSGRGAYICRNEACLKKAVKAKRLQTNLEAQISEELLLELSKELCK